MNSGLPPTFDQEQRKKKRAAIQKLKRRRMRAILFAVVVTLVLGAISSPIEQSALGNVSLLIQGLVLLAIWLFVRWAVGLSKKINELKKKLPSEFE